MTLRSTGHPVQFDGASHPLSFVICPLSTVIRLPTSDLRHLFSVLCPLTSGICYLPSVFSCFGLTTVRSAQTWTSSNSSTLRAAPATPSCAILPASRHRRYARAAVYHPILAARMPTFEMPVPAGHPGV